MISPRTPPGVMELLPLEQIAFQRFLDVIIRGYQRFGFLPVETPVFELVDVLLGKSGGDTEKQVYFVQSTGGREAGTPPDLALRFDLTVPLARYVAEHEHELAFPFRRYQVQRVYRGERAQKGRFREFYQADIDVIGKDTLPLIYDAEVPAVIHHIFHELDIGAFTIQLNNRKLMRGLLANVGVGPEKAALVLREVDKLDKVPAEVVRKALASPTLGMTDADAAKLLEVLGSRGSNEEILARVEATGGSPDVSQGLVELRSVLANMEQLGVHMKHVKVALSVARGLDYYTGTVYETRLVDHPGIGSICSGGRYDDLAGLYTKSKLPGVGISIGVTRLFEQLREVGLVKPSNSPVDVLVAQIDPALSADCLALASELRAAGLNTELAPEPAKPAKQLKYADKSKIRFALFFGGQEREKGVVAVKELATGRQFEIPRPDVANRLRHLVSTAE